MLHKKVLLQTAVAAMALAQSGGMKTHAHSSGIEFQYPESWQVQQDGALLAMLPDGFAKNEQGQPLEFVLLGSETAAGIASPLDPKVLEYLDQQMAQLFPGVRRTRESESVQTGIGGGAAVTYEGVVRGELTLRSRVYVVLHDGSGIFVAHIARKDLAARRDADVKRLFSSFRAGKRQTDPELFHTWRRENYMQSADANGSLANSTYLYYRFQPDGSVLYSTKSHTFGDTAGLGVIVQSDSTSGVTKGSYSTQDGVLSIQWPDGSRETYEYNVFKSTVDGSINLGLKAPGARKKTYWSLYQ